MQKQILFGCNYYPYYHSEEDLQNDFQAMKKVGFNQTRTAEALTSWDRMEPREGVFDWSFVDRLMDEAHACGFTVVLGTGSCCPPHWLKKKYPDIQAVDQDHRRQHLLATYNWACIDHPGFQRAHAVYLDALIKRYISHPALGYWQINNEPGYPFVQEGGAHIYCYCENSRKAFQDFLKTKYGSLANLNKNWQWLATNLYFNAWEDIELPRASPAAWGAVTPWIDWHQFRAASWTARFSAEAKQIRQCDPNHPILLNTFVHSRHDYFGLLLGVNLWKLAKTVDIFGADLYPGITNRYKREREYISGKFFLEKSIAKGKPLWVPELESGPIGGYAKGPDHTPTPRDIGRYMAECLGHGAKEISFHGWREWRPQPMHWGGLADLEGNATPLVQEVEQIIRAIREEEQFFIHSDVDTQGIAFLQTNDNASVLQGYGADDMLRDSLRGCTDILWSNNWYIEYLDPDDVENGIIPEHIRVIILPYQLIMGELTANTLMSFTHKGGTLIGMAKCGMMDNRGWYNLRMPGAGLDQVFGVHERQTVLCEGETISYSGSTFPAFHQKSILDINNSSQTEVTAVFSSDGLPAVTKTRYGNGYAWYIATHPGCSWLHGNKPSQLKTLFMDILETSGVKRKAYITQDADSEGVLDLHILTFRNERTYIVTNSSSSVLRGKLICEETHAEFTDMVTHESNPGGHVVDVLLGKGEYLLLKSTVV